MQRNLGRVLLAALAVTLSIAIAAPAVAQSRVSVDARRDVEGFTADDFTLHSAPRQANGDLTRMTVDYGMNRLRIVLHFRELDHSDPRLALGGTLKTSTGSRPEVVIQAGRGHWAGRLRRQGFEPGCVMRHHVDYRRDRAVISMRASCVDRARWVKFQGAAVTTDHWRDSTYFYLDTAPGTSFMEERFTARVHRG
ncbi:hypothetical protein [Nocardioides sp.]|uniref:hypothetical protein n=1 Tax=Nocardioides sp. TaxID=35761 RepID=UPI003D0A74B3